jgi:LysM repeat protein
MQRCFRSFFFSLLLIFFFSIQLRPGVVTAGSSAMDLINAVNQYRASYGLAPYEVDNELMSIAQTHSDYQASINDCTHMRADGSQPQDHGISSENIAMGSGGDVSPIVSSVWQDYWHFHTMVGYSSGRVGAGAAESNGYFYYTLDVKNTGEYTRLADEVFGGQTPIAASGEGATPAGIKPITTATAGDDGAVVHIVESGQSLWGISEAYGVAIPTLAAINGIDAANPVLWVGQSVIVQPPLPATQTPTITLTPIPATSTLRPTRTPNPTSVSTATTLFTNTPTPHPSIIDFSNPNPAGIAIIVVCAVGLIGIVISSILSKKNIGD